MNAGKPIIEAIEKKVKGLYNEKCNSTETEPDSDSELKPRGFDWKSIFRSPPTTAVNVGDVLGDYFFRPSELSTCPVETSRKNFRRHSVSSTTDGSRFSHRRCLSAASTTLPNSNINPFPFTLTDIEPDQNMLLSGMDFFEESATFLTESQTKVRRAETEPVNMQSAKRTEPLPAISETRVMSPAEVLKNKVELMGRTCDAKILTEAMALKIIPFLPLRLQFNAQWNLLYSIDQHGLSIMTLFRLVRQKGPCLLVIKDTDEQVFGGFVTDSFESSPTYYGSGESFLFRFGDPSAIHVANDNSKLCVYSWSGKNHYITLCEPTFISIGGGNGKFGLWIDKDLDNGVSSPCATFDNVPLAGPSEQFNCLELEIWGLSTL